MQIGTSRNAGHSVMTVIIRVCSVVSSIIIQHTVTMFKYGHSAPCVLNRYPAIYVILSVAEKNGRFSSFFSNKRRKLSFVIKMLNNKTILLLNLAEYCLI